MVGRILSFWDGIFSGSMLNFQQVNIFLYNPSSPNWQDLGQMVPGKASKNMSPNRVVLKQKSLYLWDLCVNNLDLLWKCLEKVKKTTVSPNGGAKWWVSSHGFSQAIKNHPQKKNKSKVTHPENIWKWMVGRSRFLHVLTFWGSTYTPEDFAGGFTSKSPIWKGKWSEPNLHDYHWLSSWWFQPSWKILVKLDHFPHQVRVKIKNVWNHHLVMFHVNLPGCIFRCHPAIKKNIHRADPFHPPRSTVTYFGRPRNFQSSNEPRPLEPDESFQWSRKS